MTVRIIMPQLLREYTKSQSIVEVNGNTVSECLDNLIRQYPHAERWLFDRNGILLVLIRINEETTIRHKEGLNKPVKNGDELHIFNILGGG